MHGLMQLHSGTKLTLKNEYTYIIMPLIMTSTNTSHELTPF